MNTLVSFGIICLSEFSLIYFFHRITPPENARKKESLDFQSLVKGWIERLFLVIALYFNYPHALTVFSALKLGTRLKRDDRAHDETRFNNFYLIGNFVSVMAAMLYTQLLVQVPE
jgi:hypothetical protein